MNLSLFLLCIVLRVVDAAQTDIPTDAPSVAPTASPTATPTISPTTTSPTLSPSISPTTTGPTLSPSVSPTTTGPTFHPTASPTNEPTTTAPSMAPTLEPSQLPTLIPSMSPTTRSPTNFPVTASPTVTTIVSPFADTDKYYSYDVADVYTWKNGYPQSCECVENDVTRKDCSLFKCLCSCDVTAGQCDFGCCCDPDCSSDQISRFSELDTCAFEGFTASSVEYCYSDSELYGVNPHQPLGGEPTARDALGGALCVVKTNYAREGHYFDNVELQSSSIFGESEGQKAYSYIPAEAPVLIADNFFDQNDSIAAFLETSSGALVSNGPGYFRMPLPDFTGNCNDNNYITFENDVADSLCERPMSSVDSVFAAQCTGQFSVGTFVSNLWIAATPTVSASSGTASFSDVVNVTLTAVTFEDFATGEQTDVTTDWSASSCQTQSFLNSSGAAAYQTDINSDACVFSSPRAKELLGNSTAACTGFVKSVFYTVSHASSAAGTITGVTARVVVSDVPMTVGSEPVAVGQSFGVLFDSANSAGVSATNGNLVKRQRSGNPGYVMGKPVLYGFANGTTVIQELVEGLTVPSAVAAFDPSSPSTFGLSLCPTSNLTAGATPLSFGYDMVSGCSVQLTRQQLINMCCQGSSACAAGAATAESEYSTAAGVPHFLSFTQGYYGIYGDADPLDVTQWSQIAYSDPLPARIWSDATSTCSSMYSGINLKFLVASTGEKLNPQNKIVSALAELVVSDWVLNVPQSDTASTQNFPLSATVTYVFQNEVNLRFYEPPAPPVLFHVPYDVFYPILKASNAAPRSAAVGVWMPLVGVVLCSMVVGMVM